MGTAQPIRKKEALKEFIDYYKTVKPVPRNYALITLGLHTALRISDILNLKWEDLYDFNNECYRTHLCIREKKTGKRATIALNHHVLEAFEPFRKMRKNAAPDDYIFTKNTSYKSPLSRSQAFRIIKRAAEDVLNDQHISCHSMRKTFGYQAWKKGIPPVLLMDIYNHSSYRMTQRYLGIEQDDRDSVFLELDF